MTPYHGVDPVWHTQGVDARARDTHPRAEEVQLGLLRAASPARRFRAMKSLTASVVRLAKKGIREANPDLTEQEQRLLFVEIHYGRELANRVRTFLDRQG